MIDKLDNLADAMSRVEAWLCRLQTLEEEVAALKKEISKNCIPHPQSSEYLPLPSSLHPCIPPVPLLPLQEVSTPGPMLWHGPDNSDMQMMTPAALQDVSSRANIISYPVRCYTISNELLTLALQSCCSRKKLAARLAVKIYTVKPCSYT